MNLDTVELGIVLIYYFTMLVLKCPLTQASQTKHHSANNKRVDEMSGGAESLWHPLHTYYYATSLSAEGFVHLDHWPLPVVTTLY
jgi:hypothetical protein